MTRTLGRRDFLVGSAVLAGTAVGGGFTCVEFASAAPIEVPVVDKLSIKILVDSTHNLFLRSAAVNGRGALIQGDWSEQMSSGSPLKTDHAQSGQHFAFGPRTDSCTAANPSPIRSPEAGAPGPGPVAAPGLGRLRLSPAARAAGCVTPAAAGPKRVLLCYFCR